MALTSVFIQTGYTHIVASFTLRRKYSVSLTPVLRTSASYLARLRSLICLPIFPPPLPPLSPTLYK
ncbi:hypothetical protein B0H13DRAFT_2317647 [Mycena leptocephala]|nr:hypothetical protein B0H13DRAFT_2317647 [Mycena leptocephala]